MDKKTIIALVIIGTILFGFTWYNSEQQTKALTEKRVQDSIALVNIEYQQLILQRDSLDRIVQGQSGGLGSANIDTTVSDRHDSDLTLVKTTPDSQKIYVVENDLMRVGLSSKGGKVVSVELKDYKSYKGEKLELIAENSSKFNLMFHVKDRYNDLTVNTEDYDFTCLQPGGLTFTTGGNKQQLTMRLKVDTASYLDYIYTFAKDDYMIDFRVDFSGMEQLMSPQWPNIEFDWSSQSYQNEKGFSNENNYTTVAYKFQGKDKMESMSATKEVSDVKESNKVDWVAFKQQFFSTVFISKNSFENPEMGFTTFPDNSQQVKSFNAKLSVPYNLRETKYDFQFYYGPNKFSTLKKYDINLEELVPLGSWIIGWVNRWMVIPVFDFLGKYVGSFGLIILILTILIKIVISPLTYKSYLSSAKMRLLKPEIDEITAKYPKKDEALKKQQATMELYKRAGVSPLGGCIPLIVQFPILIAMFRFFPASIELRGESFLWADDLSSYDSILELPFNIPFYGAHISLFALLMAVSIYFASKINYAQQAAGAPQMAGMKFMMLYMMPVMMIFWFNNYSSGLSYYYLMSNVFTIGQTYAFRYAVNDNKLHAKMKENAKKPIKKSKFQQRMDDMAKQQQQQLKQQPKKK